MARRRERDAIHATASHQIGCAQRERSKLVLITASGLAPKCRHNVGNIVAPCHSRFGAADASANRTIVRKPKAALTMALASTIEATRVLAASPSAKRWTHSRRNDALARLKRGLRALDKSLASVCKPIADRCKRNTGGCKPLQSACDGLVASGEGHVGDGDAFAIPRNALAAACKAHVRVGKPFANATLRVATRLWAEMYALTGRLQVTASGWYGAATGLPQYVCGLRLAAKALR